MDKICDKSYSHEIHFIFIIKIVPNKKHKKNNCAKTIGFKNAADDMNVVEKHANFQ